MNLSTQPYKGARDFYPEDKRIQKYMFDTLRGVVESFGYQEYDAPIIEPMELYLSKNSDEIISEQTYSFTDRGDRKVTLRPEMTPTVSRMVAGRRQELAYPLRWYSLPNLWRYERPQKGRLREHWQLNVDLFGIAGIEADHEVIVIADTILKKFGATEDMYEIRVNSRKLLSKLLGDQHLSDDQQRIFLRYLDTYRKLGSEEDRLEYLKKQTNSDVDAKYLYDLVKIIAGKDGTLTEAIGAGEAKDSLMKLSKSLIESGVKVIIDPFISRGFDYYTDIVFEVFDTDPDNNRSMFGGGRYDGLVAQFGVEPVPTVGFGMGDVTLQNFLEAHNLLPELKPETDVVAILIGDVYEPAQDLISKLRSAGLNIAIDPTDRKIDAKIRHAEKSGVDGVFFIGEHEIQTNTIRAKHFKSKQERTFSLDEIEEAVQRWLEQN
jgi:histidyl-tRNA synthetase